jgi:transposase
MSIFKVTRITLYHWFSAWETAHLVGLYNQPGRGRKPLFTAEQKAQIQEWVKENPKNLNQVINRIQETWQITTSKDTIKRILKSGVAGSDYETISGNLDTSFRIQRNHRLIQRRC